MLIKCVDCSKDVSDKAEVCPNCGCPVSCSLNTKKIAKQSKTSYKSPLEKYCNFRNKINKLKEKMPINELEAEKEKILNNINEKNKSRTLVKILKNNDYRFDRYFVSLNDINKNNKDSFFIRNLKKLENKYPNFIKRFVSIKEENNDVVYRIYVVNVYRGFSIKEESLPYPKMSFDINYTEEEKSLYLKKYEKKELESNESWVCDVFYPETHLTDTIYICFDQFIEDYILLKKYNKSDKSYFIKNINSKLYCFNYDFIMDIINVLQLKSNFTIQYYGNEKKGIVKNDKGEEAFVLPIII